jgi:hypothetical protein
LWVLKKLLERVLRWVRTTVDLFPFTLLGLFCAGGATLALLVYGLGRIDLVLLVIGAVGVILAALALLTTVPAAIVTWRRLRALPEDEPLRLECGFHARTGLRVRRLWWMPFAKVSWTWKAPTANVRLVRERWDVVEEIIPERRSLSEHIVRRIEVGDAFGLTRISFVVRQKRTVRFAPSVGKLRTMHVVRSIAGGEDLSHPEGPTSGERMDMRHYTPGDPIRYILWKVFARSRQLIIRTPERAISPVRQTVAYLVAGTGDEPAAGAARMAVDSGALGSEWVFGADGNDTVAKSGSQALELLARSAHTDARACGAGLKDFLTRSTPASVGRAVVFVPAQPGPWLDHVLAAVRARSGTNPYSGVEFVVCVDGIVPSDRRAWLAKLAQRRVLPEGAVLPASADDVAKVIAALSSVRAKVLLVDRVKGRVYAEGQRRALEAA